MEKYLTRMNEEYKSKRYPNGFEEGVYKNTKNSGKGFCIVAIILLVLFTPLLIWAMWLILMNNGDENQLTVGLIFAGIGLFFVIPAIVILLFGKKVLRRTPETILENVAKDNNYSESVIREYMNQVLDSDTYILHIAGRLEAKSGVGTGFLTRDFLGSGAIVKRSDIISVRLVYVSETYSVEYKVKKKNVLNIVFLCKNERRVMSPVKKEAAKELTDLLITQNPHIDIMLDNILTEKKYKEYEQEIFANLE